MTDGAGAPLAINRYDEYGVPASGNLGRFQFTGQMWIAEIGLYHFRARAYNPATGRFMQTDPIGLAGGANLYAYAGNDPVNGRDPSGLSRIPISQSDDVVVTGSREGSDGGTSRARRGDGDFNFPIFVRIGGASSPLDNQDPCNGGFSVNPDAAAGCASVPIDYANLPPCGNTSVRPCSDAINDASYLLEIPLESES